MQINGDYQALNKLAIVSGGGIFQTTGTITTTSSATVMNSTNDCTTGPCSAAGLTCGLFGISFSNEIQPSNPEVCIGESATLTASTSNLFPSFQWQYCSTCENSPEGVYENVTSGSGSNSSTYTTSVQTSSQYYRVKVMGSLCTSYSPVIKTLLAQRPTTSIAGANQATCVGKPVQLGANQATSGIGKWSIVSGGAGVFTNENLPNAGFTPASAGEYRLRWTITNGACAPSISELILQVAPSATLASIGPDQQICEGASTTLAGNIPTVGAGSWSIVSGPDLDLRQFSATGSGSSQFTPVSTGVYLLRWTIADNCSESSADVKITVRGQIASIPLLSDTNVCSGTGIDVALGTSEIADFLWTVSADPSITGAFSGRGSRIAQMLINTSNLPGVVTYAVTNDAEAACVTAQTRTFTVTVEPAGAARWLGRSRGYWRDAANWSCGRVPTRELDVMIPEGIQVTADAAVSAHSLTIAPGASVTIVDDGSLTIQGTLTNAGVLDWEGGELILTGDVTNYGELKATGKTILTGSAIQNISAAGATFGAVEIDKTGGTVKLTSHFRLSKVLSFKSATTLESAGFLEILSFDNTTSNDGAIGPLLNGAQVKGDVQVNRALPRAGLVNRYLSFPVAGVDISQLADDFKVTSGSIRFYNEPTAGALSKGYVNVATGTSMQTGRGYLAYMYRDSDEKLDLVGEIHAGTTTLPVTYTTTSGGPAADGWNLVGNPYPAPVKWDLTAKNGWSSDRIDPVISVPDMSRNYYWTYNGVDGTGDLPGGIIAMGQSFWVHANGAPASLRISEQAKVTEGSGNFFRAAQSNYRSEQLKISITNDERRDNAFFKINPEATPGLDVFDGFKMLNPDMNIFLLDDAANPLVMHTLSTLSDSDKIRIGLEISHSGKYKLSISNTENFSLSDKLVFVDSQEGVSIPVTDVKDYAFTVTDSTQTLTGRFYLTIQTDNIEQHQESVRVYPNPAQDVLTIISSGSTQAEILDQRGQLVLTTAFSDKETLDISHLPAGIYLLRTHSHGGVAVNKIVKL